MYNTPDSSSILSQDRHSEKGGLALLHCSPNPRMDQFLQFVCVHLSFSEEKKKEVLVITSGGPIYFLQRTRIDLFSSEANNKPL